MHQTMQGTLNPVFSSRQLLLATTAKPVTPFGGLVSLIEFFNSLKFGEVLSGLMPFAYTSPCAIPPEQTLLAFMRSPSSPGRGGWLKPFMDKVLESRKRTSPMSPPEHPPPQEYDLKNAA